MSVLLWNLLSSTSSDIESIDSILIASNIELDSENFVENELSKGLETLILNNLHFNTSSYELFIKALQNIEENRSRSILIGEIVSIPTNYVSRRNDSDLGYLPIDQETINPLNIQLRTKETEINNDLLISGILVVNQNFFKNSYFNNAISVLKHFKNVSNLNFLLNNLVGEDIQNAVVEVSVYREKHVRDIEEDLKGSGIIDLRVNSLDLIGAFSDPYRDLTGIISLCNRLTTSKSKIGVHICFNRNDEYEMTIFKKIEEDYNE